MQAKFAPLSTQTTITFAGYCIPLCRRTPISLLESCQRTEVNLLYTVLTWQVNAHKDANPAGFATASPQHAQPTLIPDQQPPRLPTTDNRAGPSTARNPVARRQTPAPGTTDQRGPTLNDILASAPNAAGRSGPENPADPQGPYDSDDEHDMANKRTRDPHPLESWVEGFHTGADAALEQTLSAFPGNRPGSNRLNVTTLRSPKILGKIINRNLDLMQRVASFPFWKKSTNGRPTQAHMEAHNLARMMQLEILAHKTPLEALRHRPSLEVGLRRLYAIMYVEKQIATGEIPGRGTAWQNINFLLEATPADVSTCDDIEEEMTHRLTQSKRRIAATKVITESDNRRPKRGPNNKGKPNTQEGNKRRNFNADADEPKA